MNMNNYFNIFHNNYHIYYLFSFNNYFIYCITWSSKMFPFWMWIWPKIFISNSIFLTFFFNYNNFSYFWCWNCINFPINCNIVKISNLINWWKINLFFIIVLLLGLYHEWNQNMLNWSN
uniref:NADH dehydrogenase subunit 3 n=1 Tax=Tirumala limniace TaxID=551222 RepID=A0A0A7HH80_TIRLI|nr:NADH dehydrogenase subunit 3 [Tirumala limniace]